MSLQVTNAEQLVLRRYVLGQLPPMEQDQIEDRFAADPAYFAQYQEIERDLLREYAAETMSADEARLFERNYLVTSKRREQLVILKALMETQATGVANERVRPRLGWKLVPVLASITLVVAGIYWTQQHQSGRQEIALNRPTPPATVTPRPPLDASASKEPRQAPAAIIAASRSAVPAIVTPKQGPPVDARRQLAALEAQRRLAADQLSMSRPTLREQELPPAAPAARKLQAGELPLFVLTLGGRGQGSEAVVSIPSESYWIRLGLRLEAVGYRQYTVAVETIDGTQVWRGDNLSLQATGPQARLVQVIVPSNLLHPGDYKVKLSGVAPDGGAEIVAGYAFFNLSAPSLASHSPGGGMPQGYAARAAASQSHAPTPAGRASANFQSHAPAATRAIVQSHVPAANSPRSAPTAPTAPGRAGQSGTNVKK